MIPFSFQKSNKGDECEDALPIADERYSIEAGTSAYEICQLLGQIGIRDADEYYDWLLRSGYSGSLVPGTYTFTGNETNGGIVWILLGHQ